jgi:proline dehydrogenase
MLLAVGRQLRNLCNSIQISTQSVTNNVLNFNDPIISFKTKSSIQLLRSIAVFTVCQFRQLVVRSDKLLKIFYRVLGPIVTNFVLRSSFFNHFCAGEDEKSIKLTITYFQENGIGSILVYAAEADIDNEDTVVVKDDFEDEKGCDLRAETFKQCILAVHAVSSTGFAAIKCTALENPLLLERMSIAIVELRHLFQQLDTNNYGFVSRKEFADAYEEFFIESPTLPGVTS